MIAWLVAASLAAQPGEEQPFPPDRAIDAAPAQDAREQGERLVEHYQCARCHVMERHSVERDKSCVECHRAILRGELAAPAAVVSGWQKNLRHLLEVPSLRGLGGQVRPEWIAAYLLRPHDLRRGLGESMPRLSIPPDQAALIAAAITDGEHPADPVVQRGDAARGVAVLEQRGCATCHAYTGVGRPLAARPPEGVDGETLARGIKMAPDLRWTRDRTTPAAALALLADPRAARLDAIMPKLVLTDVEKADVLAALFDLRLPLPPAHEPPPRLPLLARKVRFVEVQEAVLKQTCIHCHADDSRNLGVGGPGSSGGFGYAGTGLVLTSYARVLAGSQRPPTLDPERVRLLEDTFDVFGPPARVRSEHKSVFRLVLEGPMKGVPLLVAQLRARQLEEAGELVPGVVGMPLALPAVTPEALQLVESWVAQGRPQ